MTRLDHARDYQVRGWAPLPLPRGVKIPTMLEWEKYQPNGHLESDFQGDGNIGLILGAPSKGLTDVDLDWREACAVASKFLPATDMKSGRVGAPLSHWWFNCEGAKTEKWLDPNRPKEGERVMIVELRSTGAQTVVAPSVHPSGESYEWQGELKPAIGEVDALRKAVSRLAACALITRYWPNGTRHDAALALAGALFRNNWTRAEVDNFILAAASAAHDEELDDRARAIADTERNLTNGGNVTGLPKLFDIFGKKTVDKVVKWLDLRSIGRQESREETAATAEPAVVVAHSRVLDSILENIQKVKFKDLFTGIEAPKQKHYLVASIEQLLKTVKAQSYQLARKNDFVFAFNGEYWAEIERDTLKDFLMSTAQRQGIGAFEARHYEFRDKLYKQFIALAGIRPPEPTTDKVLINLLNGTFEITADSQALRNFSAGDFLRHQLQFKYDATATAPKFKAYLDRVLPEEELQNIVAEFMGYVFTRRLKLEKALLLYGSGANGKSVLFDVMNALLGPDNTANYSLADLMEEHNRAQIQNKLLNYGSEINASVTRDIFKILVSGEKIMARLKYGNSFLMEDYAKLCFNCNELPKDIEHSDAYFRRLLIVPFRVTIPDAEQDTELATRIIKDELSGVFNWVLAGLKRILAQRKFTESQIVKGMLASYKREADSVACFLRDENWGPDLQEPGHTTTLKRLHMSYQGYCREAGHKPLGRNNFKKRLVANGIVEAQVGNNAQEFYINHLGGGL